ncbi:MAG: hypothetical protein ACXWLR_14340 [Myxococcales bacterium]
MLVVACSGAQEVTNLEFLERGDFLVSVVQQTCANGKSNLFSVLSSARTIPDQYVVVMYPAVTQAAAHDLVARHEGELLFTPPGQVDAFGARMSDAQARALALESGVCEVFQDFFVVQ